MDRAVIVGTGVAGVSAAAAMRTSGYDGSITLVGDEPELPYRRPTLSKEVLRGEKGADDVRIRKESWYAEHDVSLLAGHRVIHIDVPSETVLVDDDDRLPYDRLLLATGGRPRRLPGTSDIAGVRTLRKLADVPALQGELATGTPVLIVGAGLIGAELSASARSLGCPVTLLEAAPLPLTGTLPDVLGRMYADLHRGNGVDLHTGIQVAGIARHGDEVAVRAADGRTWSAPLVVVAVGMEPVTELAEEAGLAVDNGIVVDSTGRTSAPRIFAAGDVANMPNRVLGGRHRVEHWQGAQNHGTNTGKAMAGHAVEFAEVPWCWSDQYGLTLQITGWPSSSDQIAVRGNLADLDFTALFVRDGELVGAVGIGRPGDVRAARKLIGRRAVVMPEALADASVPLAEAVLS